MNEFKRFEQVVDEESIDAANLPLLPLCHTTTEGYFYNIYETGFLDNAHEYLEDGENPPTKDKVLYFFYGKPSYLVFEELENYTEDPPITLLFEPTTEVLKKMKRILPFDSGGFPRYKIKKGYKRSNFTHKHPDQNSIKGLIKLLYDSNDDYLTRKVKLEKLESRKQQCWSIKEIIEVYNRAITGKIQTGEQVFSIELHFDQVQFYPKYIVLPYTFLTSDFWNEVNFKNKFPGIAVEYYAKDEIIENNGAALSGDEYQRLMRKKVLDIIKTMQ